MVEKTSQAMTTITLSEARQEYEERRRRFDEASQEYGNALTGAMEDLLLAEFPDADLFEVSPALVLADHLESVTTALIGGEVKSGGFVIGRITEDHPVQKLLNEMARFTKGQHMKLHVGTSIWDVTPEVEAA